MSEPIKIEINYDEGYFYFTWVSKSITDTFVGAELHHVLEELKTWIDGDIKTELA